MDLTCSLTLKNTVLLVSKRTENNEKPMRHQRIFFALLRYLIVLEDLNYFQE